ncbi:hypothetical protein [Poseidonocella sp. HB161398]|uniref:hypothetical protein n=1 Tax=Poseidonocella sp. HB161398 TaxID=2320855 RepID=UPI001109481D|nr:hypothetical protein [Poseidonocella sp. HB161398]
MQWLPRLTMAAQDAGAPTLIVDRALALHPFGPLLTLRLAAECETWVPWSLWRTLDDLMLAGPPQGLPAETERTCLSWEKARLMLGERKLCWLAEAREDARLPDWLPLESFVRFEVLQAALSARGHQGGRVRGRNVDDGGLDSVILCAALQERPAMILALAPEAAPEDAEPELVALSSACGLAAARLPRPVERAIRSHWLDPLLLRAGLLDLVATGGIPLAFARVHAPDLLFFDTPSFESDLRERSDAESWPRDARMTWGAFR